MILQRRNRTKQNNRCQFRVNIERTKGRFFFFFLVLNEWVDRLVEMLRLVLTTNVFVHMEYLFTI